MNMLGQELWVLRSLQGQEMTLAWAPRARLSWQELGVGRWRHCESFSPCIVTFNLPNTLDGGGGKRAHF